MKKALSAALAVSLAVTVMGPAAYAGEEDAFTVSVCIGSEPETLDPGLVSSADGASYVLHLFEGLMKYVPTDTSAAVDGDGSVDLLTADFGQAESCEISDDGLTYTFHLRDDISWSDGEPVTAGDFVYSWRRLADPATAADFGYLLEGVVKNAADIQQGKAKPETLGVAAPDDETLEVTLEAVCPYFMDICASSALMPLRQDVIEACGNAWTEPENLVCNGAYVLESWDHGRSIEMTENAAYYDSTSVGPDSITWYLREDAEESEESVSEEETSEEETSAESEFPEETEAPEEEPAGTAANPGEECDFYTIPAEEMHAGEDRDGLHEALLARTYYLYLNAAQIPDWRARAAIFLTIDRDYIVEKVTGSGQLPATGVTAAGIINSSGEEWMQTYGDFTSAALQEMYPDYDLANYGDRCALAVELMDAAAADGFDTSIPILYAYNNDEEHQAIAETVCSDLEDVLGLKITLSGYAWEDYTAVLAGGKFGIARLGWIADYNDPIPYIELFTDENPYNYGRWISADFTDLVNRIGTLPAGIGRDELLAKAEGMLFGEEGFPVAPIYFYVEPYCVSDTVSHAGWSPMGHFLFTYAGKD